MDVAICKYGQKVIFDRSSKDCDRSNTNGNVGLYKLMSLLFNNNLDINFTILSKYDTINMFKNVVSVYDKNKMYDILIIVAGLGEYEKDEMLIETLNEISTNKIILLSEDPRCTKSMSKDKRLNIVPDLILSQTDEKQIFKGKKISSFYIPLQLEECYMLGKNTEPVNTRDKMVVIANETNSYDRIGIISNLVKYIDCDIFGRLISTYKIDKTKHKGEIKYDEVLEKLKKSKCTLLVPVQKGWVTTKYIEALYCGCLPLFYKDYNISLLNCGVLKKYVVEDREELECLLEYINSNDDVVQRDIQIMYRDLVKKYNDGKFLSNEIMKYVKEN